MAYEEDEECCYPNFYKRVLYEEDEECCYPNFYKRVFVLDLIWKLKMIGAKE